MRFAVRHWQRNLPRLHMTPGAGRKKRRPTAASHSRSSGNARANWGSNRRANRLPSFGLREMSVTVVDASAVAAVLFDEPEAEPILASVSGGLIAPTLLRYE